MTSWLAAIGAALGIVLWLLKRRPPKTPLEEANEVIVRRRAKASRLKWLLQRRKVDELEDELNRQSRELAAADSVYRKTHPPDGGEDL